MFADDIFLISQCEEDLEELKAILEGWCFNFNMKISAKKTQIIAPTDCDWSITNSETGELIGLLQVDDYRYLGVDQKVSLMETSKTKGLSMIAKAKKYRGAIARLRRTIPDQISVFRAMWESVAVPGILYGVEGLVIDPAVITELDAIQVWIAKVLLGVGASTASCVSELEMGFKPFHLRILTLKINFYLKVKNGKSKCDLSRSCLSLMESLEHSSFLDNLGTLLRRIGVTVDDIDDTTLPRLNDYHIGIITQELQNKPTMMLMPVPFKWWAQNAYIAEGFWSKMLARFRSMNAGLGNRSAFYKDKAVFVENGRVVSCPLCLNGSNDEFHLAMQCTVMEKHRSSIRLRGHSTFRSEMDRIRSSCAPESNYDCLRLFLGQELFVSKVDMMYRGWALSELVDKFFMEWSIKLGSTVLRRPELPKVVLSEVIYCFQSCFINCFINN